jgi:putative nucleotidyltransferase with HDIG domain
MNGFSGEQNEILRQVRLVLPPGITAYLVGGAVRDALLGREIHDIDIILSGDVLSIARRVGNAIKAAYYPLDINRQMARLVLSCQDGSKMKLDFAVMQGADLESDLRSRDFTINALALPLAESAALIDPLGGAFDLRQKILRACSQTAILDDPIRVVRSIRLATDLMVRIEPETNQQIHQAAPLLTQVSPERLRDELFRMLDGPQPATAVRLLDMFGALEYILPEIVALKGVAQSPPHLLNVWDHTLDMLKRLDQVLWVLAPEFDQEKAASWALGFISVQLGRYRQSLADHFQACIHPERSLRSLLFFAALYHDAGKPATRREDEHGRVRFFDHERIGAELVGRRGRQLRLSNHEVERLSSQVANHMRPLLLSQAKQLPSRRAIYRFFRAVGPAGVDICLLSLADSLATYGPTLPRDTWSQHLNVVRALLSAWWEHPEQSVAPPALVNGNDLMQVFDLNPGPMIGQLLDAIREAQATGQVSTREQALLLARQQIEGN